MPGDTLAGCASAADDVGAGPMLPAVAWLAVGSGGGMPTDVGALAPASEGSVKVPTLAGDGTSLAAIAGVAPASTALDAELDGRTTTAGESAGSLRLLQAATSTELSASAAINVGRA